MQDTIFGIGPNPALENWEEDDDYDGSVFVLYVSDKETWETTHCCSDVIDAEIFGILDEAGFAEDEEGIFEPYDIITKATKEQIHKIVKDLGMIYNEDFENFMISTIEQE